MSKENHPRESKDFNEIKNIQTDLDVTQEKWDTIFHNWDNPDECQQKLRPEGCSICERLSLGEIIKLGDDTYGKVGKI
ncbi:MAG TPA: hypothetical protein PKN48_00585 [Bacteroidales bacterium]|nr:hypothetical protein [Bacteroidales bacterium]